MRTKTSMAVWVELTILVLTTGVMHLSAGVEGAAHSIVVIVNSSNPVESLTIGDLRKIFLAERSQWDSGRVITPVMLATQAPERTSFLKTVCGMDDAAFEKYFLRVSFSGKTVALPKEVGTARDVEAVVINSPGAIGFVRAEDFQGQTAVKAVKIDGLRAVDVGYRLKMR